MARQRSTCKVDGCSEVRVKGAFLCPNHLGEKRRCEGTVTLYDPDTGEVTGSRRCKRSAKPGLLVCRDHGGAGKRSQAVSERTAALTAMQRFTEPYSGALDPTTAFEAEFRRTYGRILWLETQIGEFESERDLIWGQTKEEHVSATEFAGTNVTYEARIHQYEEMLRWERKHFLDLTKLWLKAGLEEKKLSMLRGQMEWTYTKINEVVKALGYDPGDPATRDMLKQLFSKETAT